MSVTGRGQDQMHYQDGSHRWIPPDNRSQKSWEAAVREHLREHRAMSPKRHPQREERTSRG